MNQNITASVYQRLLNCAKAESRPFNELLRGWRSFCLRLHQRWLARGHSSNTGRRAAPGMRVG